MKNNGSMNRVYRIVWNAAKSVWQAVCEIGKSHGKEISTRSLRRAAVAAGILVAGGALAAPAPNELPTGGTVGGGAATISANGSRLDVLQTTQRTAIDWKTFNIGSAAHAHFQQPVGGVALNRVLDTNASQIYGKLTSTGQVFLVNPNGVLFAPGAQVDVGGIVASTLNISDADFMNGKTTFQGSSSNVIINQGNIKVGPGGTAALIAAKITNTGSIEAPQGNVLMGAGSKVTLDMGGPVKLQIENDVLETLITNGGAIKADGGVVWLTSRAAQNLASSVINNTGVIEAQTLATGEKGEIILFAHGGAANVAGRLDASAPNGGDGGFIETSGSRVVNSPDLQVTTLASHGKTGSWLIDPATYTVAASGGDETGAALATLLGSTDIQLQADSTININDAVTWSANKLTLTSGGNINIGATLTATGTGSLAFEYGQATAAGTGSSYAVTNGAKIYIPSATAFTWKKGSSGTNNNLIFDNGNLRFGDGTQAALTESGQLEQPFYKNNTSTNDPSRECNAGAWCQLTYSTYPLDIAVGLGGSGTSSWNYNGEVLTTSGASFDSALSAKSLEISGYREGKGTIVAAATLTFGSGERLKVSNDYTLDAGVSFLKTVATITNQSAGAVSNPRLWVGTRDDYVAGSDRNIKVKGNLTGGGFEAITSQDSQAKAILIKNSSSTTAGTSILFYSTSTGADTVTDLCCNFNNVTNKDPRSSVITTPWQDGSYALYIRLADLAIGASDGMTWYYAAAPTSQISSVVTTVAQSAGAVTTPTTTTTNTIPQNTAVSMVQTTVVHPAVNTSTTANVVSPVAPPPTVVMSNQGTLPVFDVNGGLAFVSINPGSPSATSGGGAPTGASPFAGTNIDVTGGGTSTAGEGGIGGFGVAGMSGRDPFGFMRVFVVSGGINLSQGALIRVPHTRN